MAFFITILIGRVAFAGNLTTTIYTFPRLWCELEISDVILRSFQVNVAGESQSFGVSIFLSHKY